MTAEFYKNREIFVTGGSGVLGKAGIEKLLRSCDVKRIYVLVRSKKNVLPEDRLNQMKSSRIFKTLKELKPNELDKLTAIPGDITLDYLGISEEHRLMMKNTSVFIHLAASTRFNLPIRTAIEYNLKSTKEALKLAETFQNLKIFLHVSTFYCNTFVSHIEDKVYPAIFDWKTALKLLDTKYDKNEFVFDAIENKVIEEFPNTYVFTKHLAEQLVNDYRHKLPVAIFRPSVVLAAAREPEPGFTETTTGVMGLLTIWGTGLLQVLYCNREVILDVVPLDASTNYMLIFLVKSANLEREKISEKTPVGIVSSWGIVRQNFGQMGKVLSELVLENPLEKSIWIPHVRMTQCTFIFWAYTFFLQLLPAMILDLFLRIFGQKPFMMKLQRQIYYTSSALRFFITTQFTSNGSSYLKEILDYSEGTEFDVAYFQNCCEGDKGLKANLENNLNGCRKFLLNEDESTLPRCRKILRIKMIFYNMLRIYVIYLVGSYVFRRIMS